MNRDYFKGVFIGRFGGHFCREDLSNRLPVHTIQEWKKLKQTYEEMNVFGRNKLWWCP